MTGVPNASSAGTGAITPDKPPHPWTPADVDHGQRARCSECGSENRAGHIPQPRRSKEK